MKQPNVNHCFPERAVDFLASRRRGGDDPVGTLVDPTGLPVIVPTRWAPRAQLSRTAIFPLPANEENSTPESAVAFSETGVKPQLGPRLALQSKHGRHGHVPAMGDLLAT